MSPIETFRQFVAAINAHDVTAIALLLADDHLFVDSLGNAVRGASRMEGGWKGYFAMCPDYAIAVDQALAGGDTVLATGSAGGTIDAIAWSTPAAFAAIVRDGRIAEWRVFADNKAVYEILADRKRLPQ